MRHDYHVRITASAEADIDEILGWLMTQAPQAAGRWHAALVKRMQSLERHPERCPLAAEASALEVELRGLLVGKREHVYRIAPTMPSPS